MEFLAVIAFAILVAVVATPLKKPYRRKLNPIRIEPTTKEKGCSTCGGNCGQCGSSH